MNPWILKPLDPLSTFESRGGGKAKNLARLSQLSMPVPDWFCVSIQSFHEFLKVNDLEDYVEKACLIHPSSAANFAAEIERRFLQAQIPLPVQAAIQEALQGFGDSHVAVRSSGLDEDSKTHSFAGQFSSFLFQRGEEQIHQSLRRCWASAFSERALCYRIEKQLDRRKIHMGVIIQKMIDSQIAGVSFSRNPIHPLDRDTLVISSVWGQGEGLVSGELEADHFVVHRRTLACDSQISVKKHAFHRNETGGLRRVSVDPKLHSVSSLTSEQLQEIAKMTLSLEVSLGAPQDCEWALYQDKTLRPQLALLQTRPISSLPPEEFFNENVSGNNYILWDNSNIIESFCGVTSPLTFSHVSRAYRQVYLQFCEVMGVPSDVISAHEPTFRNMLGLVRGRVYYNLGSWYQMLVLFPGFASSKGFMETMMGVKQGLKPEIAALFDFSDRTPKYSPLLRLRLIFLTLLRIFRIRTIVDTFKREVHKVYVIAKQKDFESLSLQELIEYYYYLDREFLLQWKAPIISDTRCMVFFGLLRKLTQKWVSGTEVASLQNDLLCGQGNLPSTEPTRALMDIARQVDESSAEFRTWFLSQTSKKLRDTLPSLTTADAILFQKSFQNFLDRYGFRCINELKLEETDLHEDPSFALEAILSFLRLKNYSVEEMQKKERAICERAESLVREKLSGLQLQFYQFILRNARIAVRDREDLRFLRTNTFGIVRRLFRAMGTQLFRLGVIDHPRDVFYLTMDEMVSFSEGRSLTLDFRPLVVNRKAEFENYRKSPAPPDRFLTRGVAGMTFKDPLILSDSDLLKVDDSRLEVSIDPSLLKGTACCPGIVEGVVRVVKTPQDAEGIGGEILVTERTDPGWVPLFPSCSGLLIERGSLLSHSAVVARELGVPTIVGISGGLLQRLKTGMRVRMDASLGEVRILSNGEPE